ncbi:unnamed protein product, partial [Mesorhabditis belari]|uniref:G-protein coupled receptors family 1 profile domain-containing protein n=1 Tax=Mesorhabditis belari TaxID=2138241 RepID=A0AAF3F1P4_9BILA
MLNDDLLISSSPESIIHYVKIEPNFLPNAIVKLFSHTAALILYILIILAAGTVRERYKHTIICHCAISIWALSSNVLMFVLYLSVAKKTDFYISIEACSIIRKLLWIHTKGQLCLLALDRYMTVCKQKPIPVKILWFLYALIPIQEYAIKIFDYSFGNPVHDVMCTEVYRMKNSLEIGALSIWILIFLSSLINLRVLIYIRGKQRQLKDNKSIKKSRKLMKMERRLTIVYFLLTIVPVLQIIPGFAAGAINKLFGAKNQVIWMICFGIGSLSQLFQALLIIFSIRSIKRRILAMFSFTPLFRHRRLSTETPSNTMPQSTIGGPVKLTDTPKEREFAKLLNSELIKLQVTPGLSLFAVGGKQTSKI